MTDYLLFLRSNARWLLAGLVLMFFSGFGQTYFISLFAGQLRAEFSLSHGEFGGIYMAATLLSAACLTYVGKLVDTHAIGTVAVWVILALALFSAGMGFVASAPMLFVVIFGLRLFGQGMMTHTAMTGMGRWYAANRGRAVSIASMGMQFGEASLPILTVLTIAWVGWRGSWFLGVGVLLLLALPLVVILLRVERTPNAKKAEPVAEGGRNWTRREVLRDPAFWAICTGTLAPPFIATTIFFHQVYLVELRGWTIELFASAFVAMSSMTIIFALIAGWAIDRFSAVRLLPGFLIPMGCACLVLAYVTAPWAAFAFMMLLGVSNGFSSTLLGALWPEIYGTRYLGSVRSVVVAMMVLFSALGPGVTGYLLDAGVAYETQIVGMALYCFAIVVVMTLVSRALVARAAQTPST